LISLRFQAPSVIGIALSVILIVAVFVITLIITLQRVDKNLLTNEGYLMFTLPVSTDRLIWSKLIVASVWNILSIVIVFIAIGIMAITEFNLADALRCFSELLDSVGIYGGTLAAFIVEFIVLCLTSLLSGILTFYACMSVSLLMNKHRVLFSFVAFLVFNTVGQILLGIGAASATCRAAVHDRAERRCRRRLLHSVTVHAQKQAESGIRALKISGIVFPMQSARCDRSPAAAGLLSRSDWTFGRKMTALSTSRGVRPSRTPVYNNFHLLRLS
jgi:hypothetical protein